MKSNILDIGCGKSKYPGSIGIDNNKKSNADIFFDIERGIPFPSNQFDLIYTSHTLEHIDPKKLVFILEEMWRVTKPHGKIIFIGPHFTGSGAAANPTHLRQGFSSQLFCYFISENEYEKFGKISFKVDKVILRKGRTRIFLVNVIWKTIEYLANLNPQACEALWGYWFGGFYEIEFQLQPIK